LPGEALPNAKRGRTAAPIHPARWGALGKHFNIGRGVTLELRSHLFRKRGRGTMRMNLRIGALALAPAAWLLVAAAHAECVAPGFNPAGNFCSGCRYEGNMSMSRDQPCERPYNQGGNMTVALELRGHRIIQRAQHGVAGVSGLAMAYMPAKGYVGKDEFTVEVDFRQGQATGKFYVHWNVVVQ